MSIAGNIPISWVYVDLEGVLADLNTAVIKHVGRDDLLADAWPAGVSLEQRLGLSPEKMFDLLVKDSKEIWKRVKPYAWAGQLLGSLRSPRVVVVGSRWGIPAVTDKQNWCARYLSGKVSDVVVIQNRFLLASGDSLLIDDNIKNAEKFVARGGHSVLWPTSWNTAEAQDVVPAGAVAVKVLDRIRKRYLCATVPETEARDYQYGQFTPSCP